ncbi:response regulator [Heyndrickxia vini]|uniref:Response regulator n=1 Tax=Heyndrickxia vini TaxID=1476025 RepID=A0ABX7E291_9BACI|nr:response regulator [Heyndrickxia vini]QQZ09379.1 response regulator [Heyndrickxia vini]
MLKLLIVDDEQIEREGLQAIIQNSYPDLIIKQAKNGKTAIELTPLFKPDLILMDIKMPGMNGLETIEQISYNSPTVKFIMVTAYEMFEYARQALKLGVKDYLLKPSKASEIVFTVGKVLKQIVDEQKALETNRFQQDTLQKTLQVVETDIVTQLLFDHVHEVHLNELVGLLDIRTTHEKFVISVLLPHGSENFYPFIKERIRKTKCGWVGALYGRQLPIIVFRNLDMSYRSQAISLARDILSVIKTDNQKGLFIGIGEVYQSLDKIRQSYQESLIATMDSNLPIKYRFYSDVQILSNLDHINETKQREKQFFDQIQSGQWEKVIDNIMDIIHRYESAGADLVQTQQSVLELLWVASRILNEMGIETDRPLFSFQARDFRQIRAEANELIDRMRVAYIEQHTYLAPDIIFRIKQYIIEHSHKDISLETIGKKVGLSPIYISKIFKEQLGINYINFLTQCRIDKAKTLMNDPNKSLKEITFEVGYHNPNYFSKVFKKMCNLSPTDYRKRLFSNKGIPFNEKLSE